MKAQSPRAALQRRDRLVHEMVHDPYKTTHKPHEPTVCPVCRAVFRNGRWQWAESWPINSHEEMCQACHRTKDNFPAGVVTVTGQYAMAHKDEMVHLAKNQVKQENAEHPLHRIMRIEEHPHSVVIKTTDIHLPHRIGEALHHAYKGDLSLHYDKEGHFVRVTWRREE